MNAILRGLLALFSSYALVVSLLLYLAGLTFFGTLYQVDHGLHEAQRRFFDAWFIAFPLPGGQLAMLVLAVNLVVGGIARLRLGWRTAGVLVVHLGVLLMLVAGWVKYYHSHEGYLKLHEGEQSAEFVSHHDWELVLATRVDDGHMREHVVPDRALMGLLADDRFTIRPEGLPFTLEVRGWERNAQVTTASPHDPRPSIGSRVLQRGAPAGENRTFPACIAKIRGASEDRETILWGRDPRPYAVDAGDQRWWVWLRERTYEMPFTIRLDKFVKEDHPGTDKPKVFMSEVVRIEGDELTPLRIEMNEPMRYRGVTAFQSGWGPQNGEREPPYTILQVVVNPSDHWPLISCIVMFLGLVFHFGRKLFQYVDAEQARRAREAA